MKFVDAVELYRRTVRIINSCKTVEQLLMAERYIECGHNVIGECFIDKGCYYNLSMNHLKIERNKLKKAAQSKIQWKLKPDKKGTWTLMRMDLYWVTAAHDVVDETEAREYIKNLSREDIILQ